MTALCIKNRESFAKFDKNILLGCGLNLVEDVGVTLEIGHIGLILKQKST